MFSHSSIATNQRYSFISLKDLLAKASPLRSGDCLAGIAAENDQQRVVPQIVLADVPLRQFLDEPLIPYEDDKVTRLIVDDHDASAFEVVADKDPASWFQYAT